MAYILYQAPRIFKDFKRELHAKIKKKCVKRYQTLVMIFACNLVGQERWGVTRPHDLNLGRILLGKLPKSMRTRASSTQP